MRKREKKRDEGGRCDKKIPKNQTLKKVVVLGSGAIQIGEAGES